MKILRLDLRAFGPFTDLSLDLSGGCQGCHIVYGPNEAGKTSALRALSQMLYGIPSTSSDNFVHDYKNLRIGAALLGRDGTRLEIVRRKGAKNTLLAPDDSTPIDEGRLRALLGGCDQAQFNTMFGISHETLVAGGADLVRGEGELGHALFAAGSGIADLRGIRDRLENEAAELFKPSGSKPVINQRLAALKEARQRVRDNQLPGDQWGLHEKALAEAERRWAEVEADLGKLSREKTRLERIARALPVLARRRQLAEQLQSLGDVPILPEGFAEDRRQNKLRLDSACETQQEAAAEVGRLEGLLAALAVPQNVLDHAEAIEDLYKALSVHRKAQKDLAHLEIERRQQERSAAEILRDLRPELPLEAAGHLRLSRRQQIEIQQLASRRQMLQLQFTEARQAIEDSDAQLTAVRRQLAELPPSGDTSPLDEAIRQARAQGDLDGQLDQQRAELETVCSQAEIDRQKLGLWTGPLEDLERLAMPSAETIDRFHREIEKAAAAVARIEEKRQQNRAEAADAERDIEALRREGDVPTEDDLVAARQLRDQRWRLLRQQWESGATVEANAVAEFEQAVRRADEIADRLRREAQRVARLAALQAGRQTLAQQAVELEAARQAAEQKMVELQQSWASLWQPLGIEPLPPREMNGWLQRQQKLVEQSQAIRARRAALEKLAERHAQHCRQLAAALPAPPFPPVVSTVWRGGSALAPLLTRAEAARDRLAVTELARQQATTDAARLDQSLAVARRKAQQAEGELADWQSKWMAAIEPLGLPGDADPVAVDEVVARLNEMHALLAKTESLGQRIDAIGADASRFHQEAERLTAAVGVGPASDSSHEQAAGDLFARLRTAQSDQKKRDLLIEQLAEQQKRRDTAAATARQAAARLALLCQEARCATIDDLSIAEGRSDEAVRLRGQLAACEEELLRLGAGATIDALADEAAGVEADDLPARLGSLGQKIDDLNSQRDALLKTIAVERAELKRMDPTAAAAQAAEDVQELLAHLESEVGQYLRLRLAATVLREGIESYRKRNEGPVLARASDHFRRLTLGSLQSLAIDFDDHDEPHLAGVRPDGARLLPTAMSEGTCDQLYLALRLASLENWLARNEPLPLVVDDILIGFDNARATAALEILAELSAQTQVIFFTHHAHLVELARQRIAEESLFVHTLMKCEPASG